MYRLHTNVLRFLQVLGVVMAFVGSASAIMWAMQSRSEDALFAGVFTLVAIGFVGLAGWMRRGAKKEAEMFPPEVR
jgi:predicted Co/Zn/Cd cation transporter (cation efflux family)